MSVNSATGGNWGTKLQNIPRQWLFVILIVCSTIPLFISVQLPDAPSDASFDFYAGLMSLKPGDKVLVASDWTEGTRAESGGECEALLRILIRKGVKIAMYSSGDPQAPQVFRDTIGEIAREEHENGEPLYQSFQDYVVAGYFPNAEGTALGINNNVRGVFGGRKDLAPNGIPTDILDSPVFNGVKSVADFKFLVMITPSNTERITFERVKKTPLMFMVTGVMAPEDQVYYASGQLKGLIGGVKGVFDLESLMARGVNIPDGFKDSRLPEIGKFEKGTNKGRGTQYYLALHACLALLVIAVFTGNLGVWLEKRKGAAA
jgi:hypothetical protein